MKILVARDNCRSIKNVLCDISNEIIEFKILN